jgi:hypothetical protein
MIKCGIWEGSTGIVNNILFIKKRKWKYLFNKWWLPRKGKGK